VVIQTKCSSMAASCRTGGQPPTPADGDLFSDYSPSVRAGRQPAGARQHIRIGTPRAPGKGKKALGVQIGETARPASRRLIVRSVSRPRARRGTARPREHAGHRERVHADHRERGQMQVPPVPWLQS
jgi:hypothetical protein